MEKADKKDPRTVFVRGVSFDIGDAELEAAFSAVGPVRHSFLIKAGRNGKHKGFGFVQFALEEDAIRATQELNNTDLGGRKIQVESALKRAPLEERKTKRKGAAAEGDGEGEKKEPAAKKPRAAEGDEVAAEAAVQAASPKTAPARKRDPAESKAKHALVRTVAVGGLSPATMDAAIASARAHGTVELVTSPAPADLVRKYKLEQDGCFGDVVLVQYSSTKDAMAAIAALHGKEVKPGLPQGKKAKRKAQQGAVRVWARQVSGEGLHLKRWRLVVRNLSFKATEADIRAAFAPAGFIWEVTLPLSAEGKPRGFAFVGFICRSHAERAIKLVNGTAVGGRPVAVDWAVAKRDFEAGVKGQAPSAAVDSAGEEVSEDEGGSDVHGEGRAGDGRILVSDCQAHEHLSLCLDLRKLSFQS